MRSQALKTPTLNPMQLTLERMGIDAKDFSKMAGRLATTPKRTIYSQGSYTAEENLHAMRPYTFASETSASLIAEDHLVRLANYPQLRGYQAQLYGLLGWSSYTRLRSIA